MTNGAVLPDGHPYIQIVLIASDRRRVPVNVMVDTGFNGDIALPTEVIDSLGYQQSGTYDVVFGNQQIQTLKTFDGAMERHGRDRPIVVFEVADDMLLGTDALRDCRLCIDFTNGGSVSVEALAQGE